ncbi:DMT family transporter [Roseateles violae]|uniref:DMT family transporter n=1 Tax=Roseateles violae TaxID=3058042 RepID=A0ABT8DQ87_9BURK|nr:DMT family transporter [Pelomonas sp. PFR6]MDN3920510.1 DMT family transporter [Pelomonas sp. PFR6]
MTHRRAVVLMIVVTLLWSTAGVVTRHLEAARSFEITFWRSAFNALALVLALGWMRGPALLGQLRRAPRLVWVSGLCWAVMFTAFMVALTMTKVANVLVTMALGPLLTALFSRLFLHHALPARTWIAIVVASAGIAWMFGHEFGAGGGLLGVLVALGVPLAAAVNWCVLQHVGHGEDESGDMPLAVLIGALISAGLALPLAWPLQASPHDLGLLAGLGVFQLAVPCLLVVRLSRVLAGPELALLGQLEVVLGVLWAWLGAGEDPSSAALLGGAMVLAALAGNEWLAWRAETRPRAPGRAAVSPASSSSNPQSTSRSEA